MSTMLSETRTCTNCHGLEADMKTSVKMLTMSILFRFKDTQPPRIQNSGPKKIRNNNNNKLINMLKKIESENIPILLLV